MYGVIECKTVKEQFICLNGTHGMNCVSLHLAGSWNNAAFAPVCK